MKVKPYIHKLLRGIVSHFFERYEKRACRYFKGLSVCYHWTYDRLKPICSNTELILNFPILPENVPTLVPNYHSRTITYTGGVSSQWHIDKIVDAIDEFEDILFILASNTSENQYFTRLRSLKGWKKVRFLGAVKHQLLYEKVFSQATVGVALLDYIPQCKGHIGNLSNTKLFEYMLMGLPIVCTNFYLWKEIIEEEDCGICVNPYSIEEVKQAISLLISNPELARKMGQNGQKAVVERYNWKTEEKKLLALYANLYV
jgi:glycosyltransferase involved in cell wall biosynthesis